MNIKSAMSQIDIAKARKLAAINTKFLGLCKKHQDKLIGASAGVTSTRISATVIRRRKTG